MNVNIMMTLTFVNVMLTLRIHQWLIEAGVACHQFVITSGENTPKTADTRQHATARRIVESLDIPGQNGILRHWPSRPDSEFKSPLRHQCDVARHWKPSNPQVPTFELNLF